MRRTHTLMFSVTGPTCADIEAKAVKVIDKYFGDQPCEYEIDASGTQISGDDGISAVVGVQADVTAWTI